MLWDEDRVVQIVREKYWITFDPKKFTFCMARWNKLEKDWWEIVQLVFTYDVTGQVLRVPYKERKVFQSFLDSWDMEELPSSIKLIW